MASLTIRNLDNNLKAELRIRAARHGCSMEAEVRNILMQTLTASETGCNLGVAINNRFAALHMDALPVPSRQTLRNPPDFAE